MARAMKNQSGRDGSMTSNRTPMCPNVHKCAQMFTNCPNVRNEPISARFCNLPSPSRQSVVKQGTSHGEAAMLDAMVQGFFLPAVSVVGSVFLVVLGIIMTGGTRGI